MSVNEMEESENVKNYLLKKIFITLLTVGLFAVVLAQSLVREALGEEFSWTMIIGVCVLVAIALIVVFIVPILMRMSEIKDLDLKESILNLKDLEERNTDKRVVRKTMIDRSLNKVIEFIDQGKTQEAMLFVRNIEWLEAINDEREIDIKVKVKTDAILDSIRGVVIETQAQVAGNTETIKLVMMDYKQITESIANLTTQVSELVEAVKVLKGTPTS